MKSKNNPFVPFVAIAAITMVQAASAAPGTWSGAFDGTWDITAANWSGVSGTPWDATNGPSNTATFDIASLAAVVSGPVHANGITFSTTGALGGSSINLVGTAPGIAVATGQTGTIFSVLAGSAGLIKSGEGLLKLSNANYTGGTTVSGGRLVMENNKTGSSDYTINSELEFNLTTGNQQLIGGTLSGTGKLIKTGGNNLILSDWSGNQTVAFTGADSVIDVQTGTLSNFFAAGAFGPVVNWAGNKAGLTVASGATFDLVNNSVTVDELNGTGTIYKDTWDTAVTLTIGVNDGSGNFSGSILNPKNSLAIVKQGAGTQTLSGGNITYKGGTTVSGGRLVLENTLTGNTNYTTDSELEFKLTTGNQQLQSGTFSGTGRLIKTGGNELILSNWGGAQTVALTGADSVIDVQAGKLSNYNQSAFGAPHTVWAGNQAGLTVASGATFEMNNTSVIVDELSGAGTINKGTWDTAVTLTIGVNDGSGNFNGAITQPVGTPLALVKEGSGTQTLSGSNTYTGVTTVSAGTLLVNGTLGASSVTVNGGAFGGNGTVGGTLTLNLGSLLHVVDLTDALQVAGTVNLFAGFGVDDLSGLDWGSVVGGTYMLINGNLGAGVFDMLDHNSLATAYDIDGLGGGRSAYFEQGSLKLVVIPEPSAASLLILGSVGIALRRRRRVENRVPTAFVDL